MKAQSNIAEGPSLWEVEKHILIQALAALSDTTALPAALEKYEPERIRGTQIDGTVLLGNNRRPQRYCVEVKTSSNISAIHAGIAYVLEIKKWLKKNCALVVPYVNPLQAQKLREMDIEFFDTAGNAFLKQKEFHIFVSGRKKPNEASLRETRIGTFNQTGLRLIFTLLCLPGLENETYRELAEKSGVSLGAVGKILNDLKRLGFLVESKTKGRILHNRKNLLKRWVEAYAERLRPKLVIGRFTSDRIMELQRAPLPPNQAFWSGEVAAERLTNYLRPQTVTIHGENNLPEIQARYALRHAVNGETELLRRFWKFDEWETRNLGIAPPLLVYADLIQTADERNRQPAEQIYEQYLTRLVG